MTGTVELGSEEVRKETGDKYELECCTSHKEEPDAHDGYVLDKSGEVIGEVMTRSFNRRPTCIIPKGSVDLDSMSTVDVLVIEDY